MGVIKIDNDLINCGYIQRVTLKEENWFGKYKIEVEMASGWIGVYLFDNRDEAIDVIKLLSEEMDKGF